MPRKRPGRSQWLKIHLRDKALIDVLPAQNIGEALKAAMEYFATGKESALDPVTQAMYFVFKSSADEANEAYQMAVEYGSKGGRPSVTGGNPPCTGGNLGAQNKNIDNTPCGNKAAAACDHDTDWMQGVIK